MKNIFMTISLTCILLSCSQKSVPPVAPDLDFFRFDMFGLGQVVEGKLVLRDLVQGWQLLSAPDLPLPPDCRDVIGFMDGTVALIGADSFQVYGLDREWTALPQTITKLPRDASHFMDFGIQKIAYLRKGKIQFTAYSAGKWKLLPKMNFSPPQGWEDIVSFGEDALLLRYQNVLTMYRYQDGAWKEVPEGTKSLEGDYLSFFSYTTNGIGVEYEDKVRFFMYYKDEWKEVPEAELALPST